VGATTVGGPAQAPSAVAGEAVWLGRYGLRRAMGLLDDAIREHLELKRRHGADPSEVAREERAALAPAEREAPQPTPVDEDGLAPPDEDEFAAEEEDGEPDLSNAIQETVEIDMRAIFEAADSDERTWSHASRGASAPPGPGRAERRDASPDAESGLQMGEPPAKRKRRFGRPARARAFGRRLPGEGSLP
jgi:hypothetical protein